MTRPLVSVLLGDPTLPDRSKPAGSFTDDDRDQVARLHRALDGIPGYRFEYLDDHGSLIERLLRDPPRFVLNFCDTGFRNEASRELHVAAYLEMLGIPYSGSGPVPLGLCFDKAAVRSVALAHGIPVPSETFITAADPLPELCYPVFMKPNCADVSLGIAADSIARDAASAQACLERLRRELPGADLLAQQWLDGAEYGVGAIGNCGDRLEILPVLEVDYSALDPSLPRLLDYGSKTDPESPYWRDVRFREAGIGPSLAARLRSRCEILFHRLGLRDYARFDFRADVSGEPRLMEVNPNPAWCWDGKLAHMARLAGRSHRDLLQAIIDAAYRRCFGEPPL